VVWVLSGLLLAAVSAATVGHWVRFPDRARREAPVVVEVQCLLGGRRRDVHDRDVEHHHQLREADDGQHPPEVPHLRAAKATTVTRIRCGYWAGRVATASHALVSCRSS
jgi:hypothetical protein